MMINEFETFNLLPELVQSLSENGYVTPTPIQSAVIPAMLAGQDVIGQSQTGTGKTAAFGLPILQTLVARQHHVQSLIMVPTRELALQVADALVQFGCHTRVRVLAVYGGQPYNLQINALKKGIDVVVGTPGRLLDLIQRKTLDLGRVSTLVLDEADEMLSMGFIADIEAILNAIPADRRTALFSATLSQGVRKIADRYLRKPQSFCMTPKQMTVATVEQRYYLINENDKAAALTRLFEVETIDSALIFTRTRIGTGQLANELIVRGFAAETLNGDLSQESRERVLDRFRQHQIKVLVATDVAARGLDIDHITHVVNFDLPMDPEAYVHRIGRTARAGKSGLAISLVTPRERGALRRIESYTHQKLTRAELPTVEEILAQREARLVEQMEMWLKRGRCRREQEIVATLMQNGYDPTVIAAAALKMARGEEKQRPIAPVGEVLERPAHKVLPNSQGRGARQQSGVDSGSHEKGMVRLILSTGKANGVGASHIVGSLSHYANIAGRYLGKISVGQQTTFVDVPEHYVDQVLSVTGNYRIGRQSVTVERA